jgi:hypothetical protein
MLFAYFVNGTPTILYAHWGKPSDYLFGFFNDGAAPAGRATHFLNALVRLIWVGV